MRKDEFLIYCLLYAVDAANIKKQNLVKMALQVDAVAFVRIYNLIQQDDDATRKSIIMSNMKRFDKDEIIKELQSTFLADFDALVQDVVVRTMTIDNDISYEMFAK